MLIPRLLLQLLQTPATTSRTTTTISSANETPTPASTATISKVITIIAAAVWLLVQQLLLPIGIQLLVLLQALVPQLLLQELQLRQLPATTSKTITLINTMNETPATASTTTTVLMRRLRLQQALELQLPIVLS